MSNKDPFASLPCAGCGGRFSTHTVTGQPVDLCTTFPGKRVPKSPGLDKPFAKATVGLDGGLIHASNKDTPAYMSSLVAVSIDGERKKLPQCKDLVETCPFRDNPLPSKKRSFFSGLFR